MTRKQLAEELARIRTLYGGDPERAHGMADDALIEYIDDERVTEAYYALTRWYA